MTKKVKRGRGRPKSKPKSAAELKELSRAAIEQTAIDKGKNLEVALPDVAEVIEQADAVTRKHRYTKEEMDDLRMKLDYIYQKYLQETWVEEAEANKELNKKLREIELSGPPVLDPPKMMSEEQWFAAHGLRADGSKPRGPKPKRKRTIFDITPGERGTADKPAEPIDLDALEKEFERQMIEAYIEEQKRQPRLLKGKRLRKPTDDVPRRAQPKNFWY